MDTVINILQHDREIWMDGLVLLFGVLGLFFLAGIFRQIKRLNASLKSIIANIQAYFDVILKEEDEVIEASVEKMAEECAEEKKEIQEEIEKIKKQEEQEKLFNAVLQEYFS